MISTYICKRCNVVLLRIEQVDLKHDLQELTPDGYETISGIMYPYNHIDRCPNCYGVNDAGVFVLEAEGTLQLIKIQLETFNELMKLWEALPEKEKKTLNGLSLSHSDVKKLLLEELI